VWQSHDHFHAFFREELQPRLAEAGLKEPEVTTYAVHSYLTQGRTVAQEGEDHSANGSI
jgi:hypothetical protein